MNEPTIDELIASFSVTDAGKSVVGKAILASLEKLAALEKPVPVEPFRRFRGVLKPVDRGMWVNGPCDYYHDAEVDTRIDSLQSALKLAQEERDAKDRLITNYEKWLSFSGENAKELQERNRRMVELLKQLRTEFGYCNMQLKGEGYTPSPDLRAAINDADELLKEATK